MLVMTTEPIVGAGNCGRDESLLLGATPQKVLWKDALVELTEEQNPEFAYLPDMMIRNLLKQMQTGIKGKSNEYSWSVSFFNIECFLVHGTILFSDDKTV